MIHSVLKINTNQLFVGLEKTFSGGCFGNGAPNRLKKVLCNVLIDTIWDGLPASAVVCFLRLLSLADGTVSNNTLWSRLGVVLDTHRMEIWEEKIVGKGEGN